MKVVIQMTPREEEKALPILLRHSPGMVLPDGVYVLSAEAVSTIRKAGVKFVELSRDVGALTGVEVEQGERI